MAIPAAKIWLMVLTTTINPSNQLNVFSLHWFLHSDQEMREKDGDILICVEVIVVSAEFESQFPE